jgi:hypothetical protein
LVRIKGNKTKCQYYYVKVDLINQICDLGVKKHGMNITKSRPNEEMFKIESGKYVYR